MSYDPRSDRIAYANKNSIFVRSVSHPEKSSQYFKHAALTTVARFSPSGFYIASGDINGNVKIWDAQGEEMITKGEYQVISGKITDIAWDADSQRIIAVGDGKERYGHCFTADSGNTVGEISGHSEIVNAVAIRPVRPYRAATVSDDASLVFYNGPPFRFDSSVRGKHTNFVHDVQFSPNGEHLVSVGADRKVVLYDGKTGAFQEILNSGHEGGIYAVAWAPDSKKFVTASADATVKLWDIATKSVTHTWKFEKKLDYHQVGAVFAGDKIISLSFNGDLNYLVDSSETPEKIVIGHQRAITSLVSLDDSEAISGSYDSSIIQWSTKDVGSRVEGSSASQGMIVGIAAGSDGKLWSTAWDDTLRSLSVKGGKYAFNSAVESVGSQPVAIAADKKTSLVAVVTETDILLFKDGEKVASKKTEFSIACVEVNSQYIAVGDKTSGVHLYSSSDLSKAFDLPALRSAPSFLKFSPVASKYLAVGDSSGKITLYDVETKSVVTNRWAFHTSRVQSIDWHESGDYVVSGSSDSNIIVYSVTSPSKNIKFLGAHKDGTNAVVWVGKDKLLSGGHDGALKHWTVEF